MLLVIYLPFSDYTARFCSTFFFIVVIYYYYYNYVVRTRVRNIVRASAFFTFKKHDEQTWSLNISSSYFLSFLILLLTILLYYYRCQLYYYTAIIMVNVKALKPKIQKINKYIQKPLNPLGDRSS